MASNSLSLNMRAGLRSTLIVYPCSINDLAAVGVTVNVLSDVSSCPQQRMWSLHAERYSRGLHSDRRWMVVDWAILC